jgi:hypothetical protein
MRFLWLLLLPLMALAQSNIPQDQVKIGRPQTSDDKQLVFDTNDGVSNKKLSVEKTSKKLKWDGNNVQIGDGAAVDKEILFNGSTGKYLKWDASSTQFEMNEDLGLDSGVLKTNTIDAFSGTETAIEQDARVKGKLNIGTGTNEIRVSGGNLEFSNDGALYKKIGSGSGGGEGGVNLLENASFEDGLSPGWTNVGGTLTQETYLNGPEGDTKYAQFVASGAGQYFETTTKAIPDFLNGGCLAYVKYSTSNNNAFKISVFDGATEINSQTLPTTESKWLGSPFVSILCPAIGNLVKLRIESLLAGTILADKGYLGSENRTVTLPCQGTVACEDTFSAKIASNTVVTGENYDWINTCTQGAAGFITCTFNPGIFTVAPNCTATNAENSSSSLNWNIEFTSGGVTPTGFTTVTSTTNDVFGNYQIMCQKQGVDAVRAKPQTAVTNDASGWFIDANIGGANVGASAIASSYTEISNAGLDLVLNEGSALAKIPCSGTNPSTGLTCASGNEGVGLVFSPPHPGWFDVCLYGTASGSNHEFYGQLVETLPSSQTIMREGKTRIATTNTATSQAMPYTNCGTFKFLDTSEKTIRMMYESTQSNAFTLLADRDATRGQRDIHITVRPSTQNIARPVLTGEEVTTPGVFNPVFYSANIDSGGVVTNEIGDFISGNCAAAGTSNTCTLNSNVSSVPLNCSLGKQSSGEQAIATNLTTITLSYWNSAGSGGAKTGSYILCHGVK